MGQVIAHMKKHNHVIEVYYNCVFLSKDASYCLLEDSACWKTGTRACTHAHLVAFCGHSLCFRAASFQTRTHWQIWCLLLQQRTRGLMLWLRLWLQCPCFDHMLVLFLTTCRLHNGVLESGSVTVPHPHSLVAFLCCLSLATGTLSLIPLEDSSATTATK